MEPALEGYKLWLALLGRKASGIRRHFFNTRNILRHCPEFTKAQVDAYFLSLKEKGRSNTYLHSLINSTRVYSQYLKEKNQPYDAENLVYPFPRREASLKGTLIDEEIEKLIEYPVVSNDCKADTKMWNLFFACLAYTGMRPGELATMKINQVVWGQSIFVLETTKTGIPRYVPIPPPIAGPLKCHTEGKKDEDLVFTRRSGKPFVSGDWFYQFDKRARRLGFKRKHVTVYSLRHSVITRLLEEDVNLFKVQKLVGHRDLKSTAVYVHLTTKDLQKTIQKLPILRNKIAPAQTLVLIKELVLAFNLDSRFNLSLEESVNKLSFTIEALAP